MSAGRHPPEGIELYNLEPRELVEWLEQLADVNDPRAEPILWRLGESEGCPASQRRQALRFLRSSRDDTFSAAVECLRFCTDAITERDLSAQAEDNDLFRQFRASSVLYQQGHVASLSKLLGTLRARDAALDARRYLIRRLIAIDARDIAPEYIDLLSDPEQWIRYNAFHRLRQLAGSSFGYAYRTTDNAPSIAAWRRWYASARDSLPRAWQPEGLLGGIGARLVSNGNRIEVTELLPGYGAQRGGLREGDLIVEIGGDPVAGKELGEIVEYELRGMPGTVVRLRLERPSTGERWSCDVERDDLSDDPNPGTGT